MVKIRNWQRALVDYINHHRFTPFSWGEHDCVTFARGAIRAMTGTPLNLPDFTYRTKREALVAQKTWVPSRILKDQLNAREVPLVFAQSGDILIQAEDYERCFVVYGKKAYAPAPDCSELQSYPLSVLTEPTPQLLRFD